MEDEGGSGTSGSHWERRVFNNDFMTGSTLRKASITELSFALLKDRQFIIFDK